MGTSRGQAVAEMTVMEAECPLCQGRMLNFDRLADGGVERFAVCQDAGCGYRTPKRFVPFYAAWLVMGAYVLSLLCAGLAAAWWGWAAGLWTLVALGFFKIGSAAGRTYFD